MPYDMGNKKLGAEKFKTGEANLACGLRRDNKILGEWTRRGLIKEAEKERFNDNEPSNSLWRDPYLHTKKSLLKQLDEIVASGKPGDAERAKKFIEGLSADRGLWFLDTKEACKISDYVSDASLHDLNRKYRPRHTRGFLGKSPSTGMILVNPHMLLDALSEEMRRQKLGSQKRLDLNIRINRLLAHNGAYCGGATAEQAMTAATALPGVKHREPKSLESLAVSRPLSEGILTGGKPENSEPGVGKRPEDAFDGSWIPATKVAMAIGRAKSSGDLLDLAKMLGAYKRVSTLGNLNGGIRVHINVPLFVAGVRELARQDAKWSRWLARAEIIASQWPKLMAGQSSPEPEPESMEIATSREIYGAIGADPDCKFIDKMVVCGKLKPVAGGNGAHEAYFLVSQVSQVFRDIAVAHGDAWLARARVLDDAYGPASSLTRG